MSLELLSKAIERIMANRYGKTVTVRLAYASKGKTEFAGCSKSDKADKGE